jgi:uncharacterized membrane protein
MDYFTYITGIATLVSFGLQIFDFLPEYKSYRQKLLYFSFGLFLGSIVSTFDGSNVQFNFKVSGHVVLISLISMIILWSLYTAYKTHRDEFFGVSAFSSVVLIFILLIGNVPPSKSEKDKLTTNELIFLSERSKQKGNYDKSILHLKSILTKLKITDVRYKSLQKKIEKLKAEQLKDI